MVLEEQIWVCFHVRSDVNSPPMVLGWRAYDGSVASEEERWLNSSAVWTRYLAEANLEASRR